MAIPGWEDPLPFEVFLVNRLICKMVANLTKYGRAQGLSGGVRALYLACIVILETPILLTQVAKVGRIP